MNRTAIVVGAGVMGRLLSLRLAESGWAVTLVDRNAEPGENSCTWTGAGMLSPYCEREASERLITDLGIYSIERWPAILKSLAQPVFHKSLGSLVVAHPNDRGELGRLQRRVLERSVRPDQMREVSGPELEALEPELGQRFSSGLYFPFEQHLDNRDLLAALAATLRARGVELRFNTEATALDAQAVQLGSETLTADWVFDCRGLGAANELTELRGVRGEILYLSAPDVHLSRPVRLMHPRYSIYIVPRANNIYLVGATMIESDDLGPITVRSALELLSAAYSIHPGFAEARLIETSANCRPGFPDNHPRLIAKPGLLRINGLFRHGFLISPALADFVIEYLENGTIHPMAERLWRTAS
ncbi:MAG: glycine oxidase ThiO [Kiritimatiellae bacterium]|nr:glycine oxidase ThiO [Kiritimatiellia bacterium]